MFDPTTCKDFPFSVEVKWRKVVKLSSWENFVRGSPSVIDGYWEQCVRSAKADGLQPLLVARGNRQPWRVVHYGNKVEIVNGEARPVRVVRLLESFLKIEPTRFLVMPHV